MLRARWYHLISVATVALTLGAGCAPQDGAQDDEAAQTDDELRQQLQDNQLIGKLTGILQGVTFMSESDYPYVAFEGEAVAPGTKLTTRIVREKLANAIKEKSSSNRDIRPATCRSERLNVSSAIAEGNAAQVPADPDDDYYAFHDKKLSIALKTMRAQLTSVVGFTFGTSESGDMDELGPVLYVYVGVSKTTGKLIALMTEAVYT